MTCHLIGVNISEQKNWANGRKSRKACKPKFTTKPQSRQHTMKRTLKRHVVFLSAPECSTSTAVSLQKTMVFSHCKLQIKEEQKNTALMP